MSMNHIPSERPRSIAEYARRRGITTQAVYKRLTKAGIDPNSLRTVKDGRHAGGELSAEGLELLDKAMNGEPSTVNQPSTINQTATVNQPSTGGVNTEVDALRCEIEKLQRQLTEEKHRAELAEAREEAAANERDYLRGQLDNAIKASALASVKRLTAPEQAEPLAPPPDQRQEEPAMATRSIRQRWRDAISAWKGKS